MITTGTPGSTNTIIFFTFWVRHFRLFLMLNVNSFCLSLSRYLLLEIWARVLLLSTISTFSNLSVTSPTSQLILQPFRRFTYVTANSPILPLFHLCHSSFSNPSFASPTSQALHLIHLASRPCQTLFHPPRNTHYDRDANSESQRWERATKCMHRRAIQI